jgi:hypothetical protein
MQEKEKNSYPAVACVPKPNAIAWKKSTQCNALKFA